MSAQRAAATLAALALVLTGCAPATTTITSTGRVRSDTVTAQAPSLTVPRVNLDAGFSVLPTAAANLSGVPAVLGIGSALRVKDVAVRLGDRVAKGDVIARFDDTALAAAVTAAKADHEVARSRIGVIDAGIDTTHDKQQEIADKRDDVKDGIAKASKARKDLTGKLADARKAQKELPKTLATVEKNLNDVTAKRADVIKNLNELTGKRTAAAEQLRQVEAALAALPPDAPAAVRDPLLAAQKELTGALEQMDAVIKQLKAGRAKLDAGIKQLNAARTKLKAGIKQVGEGIPKLTKGIATIDTNLAKARDGLKQLDKAERKIKDARADLKRARTLAVIAAADTVAIEQADTAKGKAVVRAPSDGIVSSIVNPGDVIAPGATVAVITRPALVVTTWLPPEQAALVCTGSAATITTDDPAEPGNGTLTRVLPQADYPPTFHTTDEVHLTRAVPVEVTLSAALPPGVPVDVHIQPCSTTR